jgi:hypothetical protein
MQNEKCKVKSEVEEWSRREGQKGKARERKDLALPIADRSINRLTN